MLGRTITALTVPKVTTRSSSAAAPATTITKRTVTATERKKQHRERQPRQSVVTLHATTRHYDHHNRKNENGNNPRHNSNNNNNHDHEKEPSEGAHDAIVWDMEEARRHLERLLLSSAAGGTGSSTTSVTNHEELTMDSETTSSSPSLLSSPPSIVDQFSFSFIDRTKAMNGATNGGSSSSSSSTTATTAAHTSSSSSSSSTIGRPLTTIERERRVAELHSLAQLEYNDEALDHLRYLWKHERGMVAANRLEQIDHWIEAGQWDQAESMLLTLLQEYDDDSWSEPALRIATIRYWQKRFQEAEHWCKVALNAKPWHFGALSEIVIIYAAQRENELAREWAARRLPPINPNGSNRRRWNWVKQSLTQARQALQDREEALERQWGAPDGYHYHHSPTLDHQKGRQSYTLIDEWQ